MKLQHIIHLIRWDLTTNRKKNIYSLLGFTAAIVLIGFATGMTANGSVSSIPYTLCFVLTCLSCFTSLSVPFEKKTQRLSLLTLPASMKEKLASRVILCMILWPLALLACMFVGDIIQYALNLLIHNNGNLIIANGSFFNYLRHGFVVVNMGNSGFSVETVSGTVYLSEQMLWAYELLCNITLVSFLFMCGCVWSRHAVLKCLALLVGSITIFSLVMALITKHIIDRTEWINTMADKSP